MKALRLHLLDIPGRESESKRGVRERLGGQGTDGFWSVLVGLWLLLRETEGLGGRWPGGNCNHAGQRWC